MKLIKLWSSLKTFRTIEFNPKGLTFILGEKVNQDATYNGTGKTLALILIDFCLGSNPKPGLAPIDADIYLEIEHKEEKYVLCRNTVNQDDIFLNSNPINYKKFADKLGEILEFKKEKNISLRTLFAFASRYKQTGYTSPIDSGDGGEEFQQLINIFYLLGFDLTLLYEKLQFNKDLKQRQKVIKQLKSKDIKEVLANKDKNIKSQISKLEKLIKDKKDNLSRLNVAESLSDIKNELVEKRLLLGEVTRKYNILISRKEKINKSLSENVFESENRLMKKIEEYKNIFGEQLINSIDDVLKFHNNLYNNRIKRLTSELKELSQQITELELEKQKIEERINKIYSTLEISIDLKELGVLTSEINDLELKLQKLITYDKLLKSEDEKILNIKKDMATHDITALNFLEANEQIIEDINQLFGKYVEAIYGADFESYIKIENNTGINNLRYDMEVKVTCDGSDGIGNGKILAFDSMLMEIGNSPYDFSIHDNKVFYGFDFEKAANGLEFIYNNDLGKQYIFTINQSDYNELKKEFNDDEKFNSIINNNIKIKLSTESDDLRLLGVKLELNLNDKKKRK